jgi:hypothetical protein
MKRAFLYSYKTTATWQRHAEVVYEHSSLI